MIRKTKVLIIGGSIAGLTTALCLKKAGYDVHIFERHTSIRPNSVSITMFPNAMRVMQYLDLTKSLNKRGNYMDKIIIQNSDGNRLKTTNLRIYNPRPICITKNALFEVLMEQFPKENFHTGCSLDYFEQKGDTVIAHFMNGQQAEGDMLIGADGINSSVRSQLMSGCDDHMRYSGYTCWRGFAKVGRKIINSETWGNEKRAVIINTGGGYVSWWLTAEEDPNTSDEQEGRKNKLKRLFGDWHDPINELIEQTETISKKDIYDRPPKRGWSRGNVLLIGDAAHPATPNLGQGGCSAIEDALVLTRCLVKYNIPNVAFNQFEEIRYPRTKSIVHDARILGTLGQWSNPLAVIMRNHMLLKAVNIFTVQSFERYFYYDALSVDI